MALRLNKTYIQAAVCRDVREAYIYMPAGASPAGLVMLIILVFLTRFDSLSVAQIKATRKHTCKD